MREVARVEIRRKKIKEGRDREEERRASRVRSIRRARNNPRSCYAPTVLHSCRNSRLQDSARRRKGSGRKRARTGWKRPVIYSNARKCRREGDSRISFNAQKSTPHTRKEEIFVWYNKRPGRDIICLRSDASYTRMNLLRLPSGQHDVIFIKLSRSLCLRLSFFFFPSSSFSLSDRVISELKFSRTLRWI